MNLHHTTGKPDWDCIDKDRYNQWQKMAANTKGIITPGNVLTFVGIILVLFGLSEIIYQDYWSGALLLLMGRLLDIADGKVAEVTGTKSPLGELLDASVDKISTFLTVAVLYYVAIAPRTVLVVLLLPHIAIAAIAFISFMRNKEIHPNLAGKLSMALVWLAMIGFVFVRAGQIDDTGVIASLVSAVAVLSVILGIYALYRYIEERD